MTSLSSVLSHPAFLASIRASSPNQERNEKILRSLAEIAALPAEDGSLTTLGEVTSAGALDFAFNALSVPKAAEETPAVAAQRVTCADIAAALRAAGVERFRGEVSRWFWAQIQSWKGSADNRLAAMAATAERELSEVLAPPTIHLRVGKVKPPRTRRPVPELAALQALGPDPRTDAELAEHYNRSPCWVTKHRLPGSRIEQERDIPGTRREILAAAALWGLVEADGQRLRTGAFRRLATKGKLSPQRIAEAWRIGVVDPAKWAVKLRRPVAMPSPPILGKFPNMDGM